MMSLSTVRCGYCCTAFISCAVEQNGAVKATYCGGMFIMIYLVCWLAGLICIVEYLSWFRSFRPFHGRRVSAPV